MATYATAADVETELGRTASSPAETAQWEAWLDRVERSIRRAFTRAGLDLDTQVGLDDPTADDVKDVEVAAVIRKIQNPAGLSSTTRQLDDGSITTRRDYGADGDPLALTSDELAQLLPDVSSGAWSVRPGFEPGAAGDGPYWWGYEVGNWTGPDIS